MEFKSIAVASVLLAVLFAWYAWLKASERRRTRAADKRTTFDGARTRKKGGW